MLRVAGGMPAVTFDPHLVEDDRHSTSTVASTIATTTSLSSRIAALTLDFEDKFRDRNHDEGIPEEDSYDEEEVVEVTEEQLLRELDR